MLKGLATGPRNVTPFTGSGTWTKAAGTKVVQVFLVGGGGGGGASLNGNLSGPGGNGGPGICVVTTYF